MRSGIYSSGVSPNEETPKQRYENLFTTIKESFIEHEHSQLRKKSAKNKQDFKQSVTKS